MNGTILTYFYGALAKQCPMWSKGIAFSPKPQLCWMLHFFPVFYNQSSKYCTSKRIQYIITWVEFSNSYFEFFLICIFTYWLVDLDRSSCLAWCPGSLYAAEDGCGFLVLLSLFVNSEITGMCHHSQHYNYFYNVPTLILSLKLTYFFSFLVTSYFSFKDPNFLSTLMVPPHN